MTLQTVPTMEKPPFRQNQNCGDWELKERLGMGGFAHVYLYQHRVSLQPTLHTRWQPSCGSNKFGKLA